MRERVLENQLLDIVEAVSNHRTAVYRAYDLTDIEDMVVSVDVANERLWKSVLRRG